MSMHMRSFKDFILMVIFYQMPVKSNGTTLVDVADSGEDLQWFIMQTIF